MRAEEFYQNEYEDKPTFNNNFGMEDMITFAEAYAEHQNDALENQNATLKSLLRTGHHDSCLIYMDESCNCGYNEKREQALK